MTSSSFQRPALDVLAELRRGKTHRQLTEAMHDLISACQDTGKKGELVLKLTFEPAKTEDARMSVTDQITVKAPAPAVKPSLFFLTDDGNLTRTDPNQETFTSIRDVSANDTDDTADRKAN